LTRRSCPRYSAGVAGVPAAAGTKREGRENRPRTRRCNRRRPPQKATAGVCSDSGKARRKKDPGARRPACDQPVSAFASRGPERIVARSGPANRPSGWVKRAARHPGASISEDRGFCMDRSRRGGAAICSAHLARQVFNPTPGCRRLRLAPGAPVDSPRAATDVPSPGKGKDE